MPVAGTLNCEVNCKMKKPRIKKLTKKQALQVCAEFLHDWVKWQADGALESAMFDRGVPLCPSLAEYAIKNGFVKHEVKSILDCFNELLPQNRITPFNGGHIPSLFYEVLNKGCAFNPQRVAWAKETAVKLSPRLHGRKQQEENEGGRGW